LVILASLRPASSLNQIRGRSGIPKPDSAKPDHALGENRGCDRGRATVAPMIRVTYTGFLVPVRLAPAVAFAWNMYCKVAAGLICAFKLTPSITPAKVKDPSSCFAKEPGGKVVEKVPTWSVTGWVTGLIAGAVLLKVNWE
jgi:hypothetical protein